MSSLQKLQEGITEDRPAEPSARRQNARDERVIHALFEAQVARDPDAVALVFEQQRLTYGELNARANRLAHDLIDRGVGPEVLVGICLERSVDMIVAILAVLKAGGAYVPLDPAYPQERLAFMAQDARLAVLLTQATQRERWRTYGPHVVALDTDWPTIARGERTGNPHTRAAPDNTAYVIYTSGSTGQPKGVLVSHANVVRLFEATQSWYAFNARDVWSLFHSYAFDFSVWEIWGALFHGGRLVLVPQWMTRSPQAFYALLCQERVTVLNQTPSSFRQLMRVEEQADVQSGDPRLALSVVIFGGEALDLKTLRPWYARHDQEKPLLVNMYGITETTVHVTYRPLALADVAQATGSLIGEAIPDLEVYVLDRYMNPVPAGVAGELYVGGAGLARGYLNRPELTAERFVPDPFGMRPGARLYRTGDQGRFLADGDIEYLGRIDQQVKIRGFRIELGEIETVLTAHPAIAESAVLMRADALGEQRLIAYVVPRANLQAPEVREQEHLSEQVTQWQQVFDATYARPAAEHDVTFNITGWNNSYTGGPIAAAEMREWVDSTVARILTLRPRRVLEIGCGTGLLLFRLAPHCTRYIGTDFSKESLRYLTQHLPQLGAAAEKVALLERTAEDLEGIPADVDTVVINSVLQYFPSVDYLVKVIEGVVNLLPWGSRLFLGDIRALSLLSAFHASVQLHQASDALPVETLRQQARRQRDLENELIIDPEFFLALRERLPKIGHVDILPKRARHINELSKYRYDVILHIGATGRAVAGVAWRDWQKQALSLESVRRLLQEQRPDVLAIENIPNARVLADVRAAALLAEQEASTQDALKTAGDLRKAVQDSAHAGVDPEQLWALADDGAYAVHLSWARCGATGSLRAVFVRQGTPWHDGASSTTTVAVTVGDDATARYRHWRSYANVPMQGLFNRNLVPTLRRFLKDKLPDYMVPAAYVCLEAFPLTPNGKIDRKALPDPDHQRPELEQAFVAPRSALEQTLAEIWQEVLGVNQVGVHDHFFDLGGHSLLATQAVSRINKALKIEFPLRRMFETPTVAGVAAGIEALRSESGEGAVLPMVRVRRDEVLLTSYAQQRLWFLDQLEPGSAVYNIPLAVRFAGELDVPALEQTLAEIVRRHEVLRTTFAAGEGDPVQIIHPAGDFAVTREDLSGLNAPARAAAVKRLAGEETQRPFDLAQGPLLRAVLLHLAPDEHVLLLTLHHIIADGWSIGAIIREVAALYPAFAHGQPSPLPELPLQYADFAQWQRRWLQGAVLAQQLAYWTAQLRAPLPVLELPTDRPRPAVQTYPGARQALDLPLPLVAGLREVSRRAQCTLYMTLLAAFKVLLHRYTGQTDVVLGSPIANRNRAETEGLIGFFVNTLVLRTDLSGNPAFLDLLARVKTITTQAYAHQDLPFEKLVETLQPVRDARRSPLFQVMFDFINTPLQALTLPGLTLTPLEPEIPLAKFDLTLYIEEYDAKLRGEIEYNTDLFDHDTVARLRGHWLRLLEAIVADPHRRLSDLPLLPEGERRQLLHDWNPRRGSLPAVCIHTLFEAQTAATPEAIALVDADRHLSYAELNVRANRLAHHLRALGIGPEQNVGVLLERSSAAIVAMLAVLKAGGAYVPLDPTYPVERLGFMLEDAEATLLLTQQALAERLPAGACRRLCLDTEAALIAQAPAHNLAVAALPAQRAYVMYTSGSTGTPKGVEVVHRGVVRLVTDTDYVRFAQDEVFLQLAPLSFDASTFEIWGALLNGARLVLAPAGQEALDDLGTLLRRHQVTTLWLTAPLFQQIAMERFHELEGVRQLLTGGDVVPVEAVRRVQARFPHCRLINGYGPTENTTFSACHTIDARSAQAPSIPIGRPIAHSEVYLLDAHLHPVPIGVAGDLYVGGAGLARGYLRRPDLTAEKFIPHPFSDEPGARLYCTGDRARYLPDGTLEFLGRLDGQVKIRGHRIELGEIEARLARHPAISANVVLASTDAAGDNYLVAYYAAGAPLPVSELRAYLQAHLPDYLVPGTYLHLPALPLTPNGKVDRAALPAPASLQTSAQYVAPRTETERTVAQVFAEVLGRQQVGVHDNFFDLGGHSLKATHAVTRLRQALAIELPLRRLFELPTVAALAASLQTAARQTDPGPALLPVARTQPLPLSFAQQRLWFIDQLQPHSSLYNMPVAVYLHGPLDTAALTQALNALIARHEALRTTFAAVDGQARQRIAPALTLALPLTDLQAEPEVRREGLARAQAGTAAAAPFDLAQGPLVRAGLWRLAPQTHLLLVVLHHIVGDGWSLGVLVRETVALYRAFAAGEADPLPPLTIQYADFAQWQRQWLQGERLAQQLAYWKQQLADAPPLLELPTDRPRPAVQRFRGALYQFDLSASCTRGLRRLARAHNTTLFVTLLAAFKALLYRYSGQTDLCIGTPIANRQRAELEGLIGFFVNTLVLRSRLAGAQSFDALLKALHATALEAYAHQDLPFEKLVEELQPARSLSYTPLFQVMFALQNTPQSTLSALDLTVSPAVFDAGVAKFDLMLEFTETDTALAGVFTYDSDLFDYDTIARMAGQLVRLIEALLSDPGLKLDALPLLSAPERRQLLTAFNDTERDYPRDRSLAQWFEAQAAAQPDAVALIDGEQRLSYGELNAWANQLAHYLIAQGVGPEVPVGVCLERSALMVASILGILKAGGAYVPLDPDYPAERLAFMLQDTQAPLLLTQETLRARLPAHAPAFCVDRQWATIAALSSTNPPPRARPVNLAYIIYTSGSTGKPKGVAVPQAAVARLVKAADYARFTSEEIFLQYAPLAFDASTFEIWGSLLNGAQLVIAPPGLASLERLGQLCRQHRITTLWLTSSLFNLMVDHHLPELQGVRQLLAGGEALSPRHVQKAAAALPHCQLINGYGPTEVTTFSCCYPIRGTEDLSSLPIGRPIANTTCYVLDAALNPVPLGVPGELYLGGEGLARGYFGRPELTAEKFIPHPFSPRPGERLYKTGDRVRYRSDGNLEFLGRIDHQVKLRGFRIELEEIEQALGQHPGVGALAVELKRAPAGDPRLVAYLVAAPAHDAVDADALRAHLRRQLPDYMIPAAFVWLEALPLTANGKVNREALPVPVWDRPVSGSGDTPPRTDNERVLAQVFAQVLGREQVGIHDNFFDLGGDSILSIQIVARLHQQGWSLQPKQIFQHQTVAELAACLPDRGAQAAIDQRPVSGDVPLTPIQRWFFEQDLVDRHHWNHAVLLAASTPIDRTALEKALQAVLDHHDALRMRYRRTADGWRQHNPGLGERISLEVMQTPVQEAAAQRSWLEVQATRLQAGLSLTEGPLLSAGLFHLGAAGEGLAGDRLLIAIHHLVVDGISWRILLADLKLAYEQARAGAAIHLPPKTHAFQTWAQALQDYARHPSLRAEIAYWQDAARNPGARIAPDHEHGENTLETRETVTLSLDAAQTQALLTEARKAYRTEPNDLLLTALMRGLNRWRGIRSLLIHLEGHGREDLAETIDVSRTVGWFTCLFPVRLEIDDGDALGAQIKQVKETLRAVPNKGRGYGVLKYLARAPELHADADVDLSFNYLGQFDQLLEGETFRLAAESSGLAISPRNLRQHLIDVNAMVIERQLTISFSYSRSRHRQATLRALADAVHTELDAIIRHCLNPDNSGWTPSDFDLVAITQEQLDNIF